MPGLGGEELLRRVRAAGLASRAVLVSGFIDETVEARAREAGIDAVLPKEWLVEQLGPCLRALMERDSLPQSPAAAARPVALGNA
jgi:CheY-like chemotaxis protein